MAVTANYSWAYPTVGADSGVWGGTLNTTIIAIDAQMFLAAPKASPTFTGAVNGATYAFTGNCTVGGTLGVTGVLTATGGVTGALTGNVTGNLTGNVTGNTSGSSGSCTGNSATATTATTATNQSGGTVAATTASFSGLASLNAGGAYTLAAAMSATEMGYGGLPQTTHAGNYALVAGDRYQEQFFTATATATIPANASVAYPIGTIMVLTADAGTTLTVAITADTMRWVPSNTTGSRTVTGPGYLTAVKKKATEWWVSGPGVS